MVASPFLPYPSPLKVITHSNHLYANRYAHRHANEYADRSPIDTPTDTPTGGKVARLQGAKVAGSGRLVRSKKVASPFCPLSVAWSVKGFMVYFGAVLTPVRSCDRRMGEKGSVPYYPYYLGLQHNPPKPPSSGTPSRPLS